MQKPRIWLVTIVAGSFALGTAVVGAPAIAGGIAQVFVTNDNANSVPVHGVGTQTVHGSVAVDNAVRTRPAVPATQFQERNQGVGQYVPLSSHPLAAGERFAVTTLIVSNRSTTDGATVELLSFQTESANDVNCDHPAPGVPPPGLTAAIEVPAGTTTVIPFSVPLVTRPGDVCLGYSSDSSGIPAVTVVGNTF